jgi:hypothetical protein
MDVPNLLGVFLYNARAAAAPADTSHNQLRSLFMEFLVFDTRSFAIIPIGVRTNIESAITTAVFLPV